MKGKEKNPKYGRVLNVAVAIFAALILSILPVSMMVDASANAFFFFDLVFR